MSISQHIVSCSLGKDSVAMLIRMLETGMPVDRVIFADVGEDAEFAETYDFIGTVEEKLGIGIERVRSDVWTFDKIFYSYPTRGKKMDHVRGFPPVVHPGCRYRDWLKVKPMDAVHGEGNIIYLGIAADEAHRTQAKSYQNAKNQYRFPLVEWNMTEAECRALCESRGLLHPLYQYFSRLGCWQCPKQGLNSLRALYAHWPEKWAKLQKYQDACTWDFRPGWRVEDLTARFEKENNKKREDNN